MPSSNLCMSLEEFTTCRYLLDGHREYAIDLLTNIEKIRQWHDTDTCPGTREDKTCMFCELLGVDGLMDATTKALASYKDTEDYLQGVHTSFAQKAFNHRVSGRQTLFKSDTAKAIFFCITTMGEGLRSQHQAWQARLQNEVANLSSSAQHGNLGKLKKNQGEMLLPDYSGPTYVYRATDPKLASFPIVESPSRSSMFMVFKRCLSADCPCEDNKANLATNVNSSSAYTTFPSDSKKSKVMVSATTNSPYKPRGVSDNPSQASPNALEEQGTSRASCSPLPEFDTLIVNPRVLHLRALIVRFDDTRRTFKEWCLTLMTSMHVDLREEHGTRATRKQIARETRDSSSVLVPHVETVDPGEPPCKANEALATMDGKNEIKIQAEQLQFESEQKGLQERWSIARRERYKGQKGRQ